jgi:dihydrofolate reductase
MRMAGRTRVFIACSLDGFIAGEGDDLSFLPQPDPAHGDAGYGEFMRTVGCILMGRRTYDVVSGFPGPWPYGATPVLVATHRPLLTSTASVQAVAGEVAALLAQARAQAGDRDVYLDGGQLIRAALDAGLVDELTVTLVPVLLGRGIPLWTGVQARQPLRWMSSTPLQGGMVQLVYVPCA